MKLSHRYKLTAHYGDDKPEPVECTANRRDDAVSTAQLELISGKQHGMQYIEITDTRAQHNQHNKWHMTIDGDVTIMGYRV